MKIVDQILDSRVTSLVARILLCSAFLQSLYDKAVWPRAVGEMAHFNLQPAPVFAGATIAVQILGVVLIIWGRYAWVGAVALSVFTLLTIPIAHGFWGMTGQQRMVEIFFVYEHISVIGGLMLAALLCRREGKPT
jgi:transmembrane protein